MIKPTQFEIVEHVRANAVTLSVSGELDLNSAPTLARHVEDKLAQGAAELTLDLAEVVFMDSSGLRLLIELNQQAGVEDWRLALLRPQHESTMSVLRLTGADTALPFQDHS